MSIQTNVLEHGEWVTRTLTADELMRDQGTSRRGIGRQPPSKPPMCGLLTRTIMDSPVVLWTLPIKIRPSNQNDIALIGVRVSCLFLLPSILRKATRLASLICKPLPLKPFIPVSTDSRYNEVHGHNLLYLRLIASCPFCENHTGRENLLIPD